MGIHTSSPEEFCVFGCLFSWIHRHRLLFPIVITFDRVWSDVSKCSYRDIWFKRILFHKTEKGSENKRKAYTNSSPVTQIYN